MKKAVSLILVWALMAGSGVYAGQNAEMPPDVAQSHWVFDSVKTASDDGWLVLDDQGSFRPDTPATRKTVAKLLTGAWDVAEKQGRISAALPAASACSKVFSDIGTADAEAQESLKRLVAAGVLSGYPEGLIKPDGPITRMEMAVMLSGICSDAGAVTPAFSDQAKIPQWGKPAVIKAASMGLISGYTDGTFRPSKTVTHAEALQMLSRWIYPQKAAVPVSRGQTAVSADPMTADILRLVNGERAKKGLGPLRVNQTLSRVAMTKASGMAEGNYFSHVSPTGEGVEALFTRLGIHSWSRLGENLLRLKGSVTAEKAVAAWMQSDSHRAIILTPFTDTGIGFARSADGTVYIAQAFAAF